ncbi:MAG TPA: aminomethyl-transferring glycine dehydrogenase subunit GcvPA [Candidatus Binatia bacterium]|nr:aminomethyl-transferring glycine dehydrogenase subunit GcvPA [Candidatus Binatia bacterium]
MPFIPHTDADVREMLAAIGAKKIDELFDEIPAELRCGKLSAVPEGLPEQQVARLMHDRAQADGLALNFIGAGAYEHHIPAAVWEITTRGEFYSAYTPYQAEASQGTLQVLYEFQSMITALTGMEVANASLYDGASALGEALLMAVRANPKSQSRRVLVPTAVHPYYREAAHSIAHAQGVTQEPLVYCAESGATLAEQLKRLEGQDLCAVVIQQPNFFGVLEDVDALTDWAHAHGALVIAVVNPTSLALLKPPGQWGAAGADIVVGEGQPLGAPLASGGPYFGFMCAKQQFVRQMPGRIAGRTVDLDGKPGFTLTLQAREQHIRRSKATSNICTNQGLLVTAATIYMSIVGPAGLAKVASTSMARLRSLRERLAAAGAKPAFTGAHFHECVLRLDRPVAPVLAELSRHGIVGGLDLSPHYPELGHALLVCATETKTEDDLARYADALRAALGTSPARGAAQAATA